MDTNSIMNSACKDHTDGVGRGIVLWEWETIVQIVHVVLIIHSVDLECECEDIGIKYWGLVTYMYVTRSKDQYLWSTRIV